LGVPDSVKFDGEGFIISTQVGSGQVLRIDPRNGATQVLADIGPGLDNCTFVGDRLFVSHMTGSIHEILGPGKLRTINEKGLLWPLGIAVNQDGGIYVSDGVYAYEGRAGDGMHLAGMLFTEGFPGQHCGAAATATEGWIVTTSIGEVKHYLPREKRSDVLTSGFDVLAGVAVAPDGRIFFADFAQGRVLMLANGQTEEVACGLDRPTGVAFGSDGVCYVAEYGMGCVKALRDGKAEIVLEGLRSAEGLTEHNGKIYVIDVLARELVEFDLNRKLSSVIVKNLPVGMQRGPRKHLGPAGAFSGPIIPFAGLAAGRDGTLYVSADGNGSVMSFSPAPVAN